VRIILSILVVTLALGMIYYFPLKAMSAEVMEEALSDANDDIDALLEEDFSLGKNSSEPTSNNTTNVAAGE
jgi:hypothetical protein